jgi:hypothetical protein
MAGTAVAHAGIFGIDFFGDDHKSRQHHPRPGSDTGAQESGTVASAAAVAGPPVAKIGSEPVSASRVSAPESVAAASAPEAMTTAGAPESLSRVGVPESVARNAGGGGAISRSIGMGRASNLPPVSTAPATRSVVIRGLQGGGGTPAPSFVPRSPISVPLAAPPPAPQGPDGRPAPAAPLSPSPQSPFVNIPGAPIASGVAQLPNSFRAGYHEYLRTASTTDLFVAALPGVAGIAGFTLVGAYAGYRQARSVQKPLLAPVPTSVQM